jgi:KaiC/GvpD/RAD55 family RecA-like ATPase
MEPIRPLKLSPEPATEAARAADPFLRAKKALGLCSGFEIDSLTRKLPSNEHLVQGLLAPASVNLLVGDSGVGKSPLAYQLALAVACGTPFLGLPVRPGKVLYVDFENHQPDIHWILVQQRKRLGITRIPGTLVIWPLSASRQEHDVEKAMRMLAPDLVILDSLRTFSPQMESDPKTAVLQIKRLRTIAARDGSAFLLIHHIRKHLMKSQAGLEGGQALEWLRRAAGVRALVNQTDTRLAFARREKPASREEGAVQFVLSGHFRTRGDVGPYILNRVWDDEGEPMCYERFLPSPDLIANPLHELAFSRLSDRFSFKDAELALCRAPEAVNWFIQKLIRLGLAEKTGRGQYRKVFGGVERTA